MSAMLQLRKALRSVIIDECIELLDLPFSCSTTMTSIAPLKVAGFMELYVLATEPAIPRTYCMSYAM